MIERSCLPGSGRVYFSASLSPEALAKAGHVFLMVDLDCAHSWTVNRRSMSPTIFRSARSALDQAPVTIARARRRTRAMTISRGNAGPAADQLIVRSTSRRRSSRSVNERVGVFRPHDLSLRNSVRLYEPRQKCRLLRVVATITPVL